MANGTTAVIALILGVLVIAAMQVRFTISLQNWFVTFNLYLSL